jgi:polyhydroxyalkanoate synthesis repressor PhaR
MGSSFSLKPSGYRDWMTIVRHHVHNRAPMIRVQVRILDSGPAPVNACAGAPPGAVAKTVAGLDGKWLCSFAQGAVEIDMAKSEEPVTIKKYANRRLYNTGTSTYVTLEDLATMVKSGDDFVVFDAKTGEDITRSVLAQIIFEQEAKEGQSLLPITFLRQLIRFYGDSMQMMVPRYLEVSIDSLTREQEKFRAQMAQAFGGSGFGAFGGIGGMEEQVRRNMEMFERAFTMFAPFARRDEKPPEPETPPRAGTDMDDLKRQLDEMQRRLDRMSDKEKG